MLSKQKAKRQRKSKKYRSDGYMNAVTCMREIASQIGSWFEESRPRKKKKNKAEDESCEMSQDQFKANFYLPLMDHAICCLINRFEQMCRCNF